MTDQKAGLKDAAVPPRYRFNTSSLAIKVTMLAVMVACWASWVPISTTQTRAMFAGSLLILGLGLLRLVWSRRYLRLIAVFLSSALVIFIVSPNQPIPAAELRKAYIHHLLAYRGSPYFWGGESSRGIDCSGLIRKAMINAHLSLGFSQLNAQSLRNGIWLWWQDRTAADLSDPHGPFVTSVDQTPSLNALNHDHLRAGDLAVTLSGKHMLAYLGDSTWIQADPYSGKVVAIAAPSNESEWYALPMRLVRWKWLTH